MTRDSSGPNSSENEEPLSATAMFLRSMDGPAAAPKQDASWGAPSAPPTATPAPIPEPVNAGPGEFTRMFQLPQHETPAPKTVTPAPQAPPLSQANAGSGEFTQIFYTGSGSQEAKTLVEAPRFTPPAAPQPGAAPRKGFSTPGISDSASGEGSVTQILKPAQASGIQPPAPVGPMSAAAPEPLLPNPAYVPEPSWKAQAQFASQNQPASGPSVTKLISSLAEPASPAGRRGAEPVPYSPAPQPAYTPAAPLHEPLTPPEAGSVTRLIQRLAQGPVEPVSPAIPHAAPVAPANSGPGEFTRMISLASAPAGPQAGAPQAAPPPPAALPVPQFPAMPAVAMPPLPQMPHLQAGAPAAAPAQMHMPQLQMPKAPAMPPMPQLAPPKGKLEAMVPALLIVNTFLLVLILVVVLFALKAH